MYKSVFDPISHYKNRDQVIQVVVFDFTGRYTLLSVSTTCLYKYRYIWAIKSSGNCYSEKNLGYMREELNVNIIESNI